MAVTSVCISSRKHHTGRSVDSGKTKLHAALEKVRYVDETDNFIETYAAVYENLDFSKLDIHGRYRKVVSDKSVKHSC